MATQAVSVVAPGRYPPPGGLLDTVTDTLFGPLFPSIADASEFIEWHFERFGIGVRVLKDHDLIQAKAEWEVTHAG